MLQVTKCGREDEKESVLEMMEGKLSRQKEEKVQRLRGRKELDLSPERKESEWNCECRGKGTSHLAQLLQLNKQTKLRPRVVQQFAHSHSVNSFLPTVHNIFILIFKYGHGGKKKLLFF